MMFVFFFLLKNFHKTTSILFSNIFFDQLIQKEYFNLQVQSDRRLMEIDTELNEKRTKLQVYEKVEQELDEVVMQAAQGNKYTIQCKFYIKVNKIPKETKGNYSESINQT